MENLVTYSEAFDNASWAKTNVTVTANATTAPDGTMTADKIIEGTGTVSFRIYNSYHATPGSTYTISVFLKYGNRQYVALRGEQANQFATFDLLNGTTAGKDASVLAYSITNVGSGWYRASATFVAVSTGANFFIHFANSSSYTGTSYAGSGSDYVYSWGAQIENVTGQSVQTAGSMSRPMCSRPRPITGRMWTE